MTARMMHWGDLGSPPSYAKELQAILDGPGVLIMDGGGTFADPTDLYVSSRLHHEDIAVQIDDTFDWAAFRELRKTSGGYD